MTSSYVPPRNAAFDDEGRNRFRGSTDARTGIVLYEVSPSDEIRAQYLNDAARRTLRAPDDLPLPCPLSALGLSEAASALYAEKLRAAAKSARGFTLLQETAESNDGTARSLRFVTVEPLRRGPGQPAILLETSRDAAILTPPLNRFVSEGPGAAATLEESASRAWLFDPKRRVLSLANAATGEFETILSNAPFPDALIEWGVVHPQSAESFRSFARRILCGEKRGAGFFALRLRKDGNHHRCRVDFESDPGSGLVFGTILCLGMQEALPQTLAAQALCAPLFPALHGYAVADLTENRVEPCRLEGRFLDLSAGTLRYTDLLEKCFENVFDEARRQELREDLAPECLKVAYRGAPRWLCEPFVTVENNSRLLAATLYVLLLSGEEERLTAHFYLVWSEKTESESRLLRLPKILRDEEGLCKPGEDRHVAEEHLAHATQASAFALIRMALAPCGQKEERLSFLASTFGLFFESRGIVSRAANDAVKILLPDCATPARARKAVEDAFAFARRALDLFPGLDVRFTAVFTHGEFDPVRLESFWRDAADTLAHLAPEPADAIEHLRPEELAARAETLRRLGSGEAEKTEDFPVRETLSPEENALLLQCLDLMIRTPRPAAALEAILAALGRHYGAARVYTLQLSEDSRTVEEATEWTGEGRPAIRPALLERPAQKFPLLMRALVSRKPAFVRSAKRNGADAAGSGRTPSWTYAIVPCGTSEKTPSVLLVIDGPEAHREDRTLPVALGPYVALLNERMLKARNDVLLPLDTQTNVLTSPAACHDALASLNSEHCVTMGALVAAVPHALKIANENGTEHFAALMQTLARELRRTFANAVLVHLFDMEFALLVPNVAKEAFFERADDLKRFAARTFPGQVATGASWSRGVFSGESLLKEARTIMLSQADRPFVAAVASTLKGAPRFSTKTIADFTVYYQPKFDLRTGRICGAEALVRGLDERSNLISPAHFIPQMEKSGALRELDIFVLSRVLWQMNVWKSQGLPLVPVAVNFSRFTVFDHSAVGAVLAVLSHYDRIDPSLIEIEITETACSVEKDTLEHALRPYRDLGFRFALDDFGTGYSNLSMFSKVRFDTVKLDRSLILDIVGNPVSRSLVESIVGISREQNAVVVAEGVETEAQAKVLLSKKCFVAQGNFYEHPLPSEDFSAKYLQNGTINAQSTFGE